MAEGLITISEILAVSLVFLSCALSISLLMDKLSEGFGSSGFIEGAMGIGVGVVVGVLAGDFLGGEPGSHLGGVVGGVVGIGVVYVWLKVVRSLGNGTTH